MSKYSDSPELLNLSVGSIRSANRQTSFTNIEHAIASVVKVLAGNAADFRGVGDVYITIKTDQGRMLGTTASPMNPHMFTIPLPNEKIHCIKDSVTGDWFYTGIHQIVEW